MPPPHRRPISQWFILLIVWTLGLMIWAIYIAAFIYLFFSIFG